jgi:hypothetical protein
MGGSRRLGEASLPELNAALGREQFIAVLEGKGTRDPLDRPFAGRWCAKGGAPTLPAYCWLAPMVYPWRLSKSDNYISGLMTIKNH